MRLITFIANLLFGFVLLPHQMPEVRGLLYPFESETREVRSLCEIPWNFYKSNVSDPQEGYREKFPKRGITRETILMPVPSSYNDITTDASLRDHVGIVWYERKFFIPQSWDSKRVWIHFGSVHYAAVVWVNGIEIVKHEIGHLPFGGEVTKHLNYGKENRITVLCDNVLLNTTIPQGTISKLKTDEGEETIQSYTFDFFNYAGIHRPVHLYTTPSVAIDDIFIETDVQKTPICDKGVLKFTITPTPCPDNEVYGSLTVDVNIFDKIGQVAGSISVNSLEGEVEIENVKKWWPIFMDSEPGYLYKVEFNLKRDGKTIDTYRRKIGFRTLRWDNTSFYINDKPVYLRGFGKHEDSDIRGKGLDWPLLIKDFNLLKWMGANTYRTSHYPYSEESMQLADELGIMIIDECPSVNAEYYQNALLVNHKKSIVELINRDRAYASVIMWSIANEPTSQATAADEYFKEVANFTRHLDGSRPFTAAIAQSVSGDKANQHLDIIMFNRYNAWYSNAGRLNTITGRVIDEARGWHKKHNKPVLVAEYGGDTQEGLHILPAYIWSEEFQEELFSRHFEAFDNLRKEGFFIGEFVWNFADFKTAQTYTRVGGNKKGVFTRSRQPKAAAHLLRKRYHMLGKELDGSIPPSALYTYVSSSHKDEL